MDVEGHKHPCSWGDMAVPRGPRVWYGPDGHLCQAGQEEQVLEEAMEAPMVYLCVGSTYLIMAVVDFVRSMRDDLCALKRVLFTSISDC